MHFIDLLNLLRALLLIPVNFAGAFTAFPIGIGKKNTIKRLVQGIKQLAREYAASVDDQVLLRRIERAMEEEEATFRKRWATVASREKVGA